MTPTSPLAAPMLSLMALTFVVWCHMYVMRLGYLFRMGIDPQRLNTPAARDAALPDRVNNPSNNFRNLFELPVLFYLLCTLLIVQGRSDTTWVALAWSYVSLRAIHSLIHCTINIVKWRFVAYLLSSFVLWFMVARLAWSLPG